MKLKLIIISIYMQTCILMFNRKKGTQPEESGLRKAEKKRAGEKDDNHDCKSVFISHCRFHAITFVVVDAPSCMQFT